MIVGAFIAHRCAWILETKLRALGEFCDAVVVVLDRGTSEELSLCYRYGADVVAFDGCVPGSTLGPRGVPMHCREGAMRQAAWDRAERRGATLVVLGDADEVPTPMLARLARAMDAGEALVDVDCAYVRLANLWGGRERYVAAGCAYGLRDERANWKGALVRVRPGTVYRYDVSMTRHCRVEPNPLARASTVEDARHVKLRDDDHVLVHHKWADLMAWLASEQSALPGYRDAFAGAVVEPSRPSWFWPWEPVVLEQEARA